MGNTEKFVLSKIENNIGFLTFNRPQNFNTFTLAMADQFLEILNIFKKDETVRAIVIKGNGKVFSAGGDVKEMWNDVCEGKDRASYFRSPLTAFGKMCLSVREIPKPVLVAVHGAVAGVAFNFMLSCDLILAEEKTRFTQAFARIGLSPDGGGTYSLPRIIGYARACELTFLPTEIDASTALNWGMINWVESANNFDAKIKQIAERLAKGSIAAIGRTKSLLNQSYKNSLTEQMEAERLTQIENSTSNDFEEGLKAFIEKREPVFWN